MKVILYSTHCPRCNVLESKLKAKNIAYEEINDEDIMVNKGFLTIPILEVEDKVMDFKTANDWINAFN